MSAAAAPAALTDPLLRASLFEDAVGALPPSAFRAAPPRAEVSDGGKIAKSRPPESNHESSFASVVFGCHRHS